MKVSGLGDVGVITDRDKSDLPPNGWSKLENVRCRDGFIEPVDGYIEITSLTEPGSSQDIHIHQMGQIEQDGVLYTIYAYDDDDDGAAENIYSWNGVTHTDLTSAIADYSVFDAWTVCEFNGLLIFNNGTDNPFYTNGDGTTKGNLEYNSGTTWATQGYSAKVIRAFGNYLIALDVTDSGSRYEQMVHWSSPAAAGNPAGEWRYNLADEDSARIVLAETDGRCVDAVTLNDQLYIFKEDAIHRLSFVGGQFVFQNDLVTKSHGLWATDCVVDIGGTLFCMGDGLLYVFDGQTQQDILAGKAAREFFDQINPDVYENCFLTHNKIESEVWCCFPSAGFVWPNRALIYNYRSNAVYYRDIPFCTTIKPSLSFDSGTALGAYSDYTTETETEFAGRSWGGRGFSPVGDTLVGAGKQLFQFGEGKTSDSVVARRENLVIGNPDQWFMLRNVMPYSSGDAFKFRVGTQSVIDGPVSWDITHTFDPGIDYKLDQRLSSRVFAIEVSGTGDWKMSAYSFDAVPAGRR